MNLVRVWDELQTEVASGWVEWEPNGAFELPADDALAALLFDHGHLGTLRLTVYSTEELMWTVTQVDVYRHGTARARVTCAPFIKTVRQSLVSDDWLVGLWLEAENSWKKAS